MSTTETLVLKTIPLLSYDRNIHIHVLYTLHGPVHT